MRATRYKRIAAQWERCVQISRRPARTMRWGWTGALLLTPLLAAGPSSSTRPFVVDDRTFGCIRQMTAVRHFYVANLAGDLPATLSAARSTTGAVYPVGSVLQLVPTEAMVKRETGFNAATHDWEFYLLNVSKQGTTIQTRGFVEVTNRFGANCFACHVRARPEWDLICDNSHGCDPIPITREMIGALQRTDPRCQSNGPVSEQDAALLAQLAEVVKTIKSPSAAKP
jgi:hypothetical protein